MASGLALVHERVATLRRLGGLLEAELYDEESGELRNLWLPDAKQIGSGESAERVDLLRFNEALIRQLREVLDDIAREVGGRRPGLEISGGGDFKQTLEFDLGNLPVEVLRSLADGRDPEGAEEGGQE